MDSLCGQGLCAKPAALMHNDVGYCVDHYRLHPDTILRPPHLAGHWTP